MKLPAMSGRRVASELEGEGIAHSVLPKQRISGDEKSRPASVATSTGQRFGQD
jgi:hypothetical protein